MHRAMREQNTSTSGMRRPPSGSASYPMQACTGLVHVSMKAETDPLMEYCDALFKVSEGWLALHVQRKRRGCCRFLNGLLIRLEAGRQWCCW